MLAAGRRAGGLSSGLIASYTSPSKQRDPSKAIGVRGGSSNEQWRCLVSNSGKVQDLSVVGN